MDLEKKLKERHIKASDFAKWMDISTAHVYSIMRDFDKAGDELKEKIYHFFSECHVCHRPWPKEEEK